MDKSKPCKCRNRTLNVVEAISVRGKAMKRVVCSVCDSTWLRRVAQHASDGVVASPVDRKCDCTDKQLMTGAEITRNKDPMVLRWYSCTGCGSKYGTLTMETPSERERRMQTGVVDVEPEPSELSARTRRRSAPKSYQLPTMSTLGLDLQRAWPSIVRGRSRRARK